MIFKLETNDLMDYKLLASNCQRNHVCLEYPDDVLCEVDYCVNNQVLFVKSKEVIGCTYLYSFGYSHFCSCPVRMLIYKETKK